MKIIKPSYEILTQDFSTAILHSNQATISYECNISAKKQIELAGRICYKSESKITDTSFINFFNMIKDKQHLSVFEHGTLYFTIYSGIPTMDNSYLNKSMLISLFKKNPYSKVIEKEEPLFSITNEKLGSCTVYYITTNYRVIEESINNNDFINEDELMKYLSIPNNHHLRISVKFICNRSISHELVRHRVFSFSQESQRYCNYSLDKFSKNITFIEPLCLDDSSKYKYWINCMQSCEEAYFNLIDSKLKPQDAREVLPNSTKTELIMTGFVDDWKQFFKLRTSEAAHPEMRRLIVPLEKEFKENGWI